MSAGKTIAGEVPETAVAIDELELLEKILAEKGTIILRNGFGTMELRGQDLTMKTTEGWLTIYHSSAPHSEHRSHIHMKRGRLKFARVLEKEKGTPRLAFYESEAEAKAAARDPGHKPPFSIFFASFFDWQSPAGPRPLEENQARFADWTRTNGRAFRIQSES